MTLTSKAPSFNKLVAKAEALQDTHLRTLLADDERNRLMSAKFESFSLDYCRQKIDTETLNLLFQLANEMNLQQKIQSMYQAAILNSTEKRPVLHVALRSKPDDKYIVEGKNVVPEVHQVLQKIKRFSSSIRNSDHLGFTGKALKDVVCIGIGGSYLGPEFVYEALRTEKSCAEAASGRRLRFLANIDPVDVKRALEQFHPETTLVIIVSKTFTTAETILNAKTVREWLLKSLHQEAAVARHMVAVSTNLTATTEFGIHPSNVFGFWDWTGGRFSVTSAVGILPLAIHFGYAPIAAFLEGCNSMDMHFKTAPLKENLPVLLGLTSVWNSTFMKYASLALLPYSQALLRFPAHIQQVAMESNGKRVTLEGEIVEYGTEQVIFGEPGTNGQHSFYQLLHQGRVVPAEFIGSIESQYPLSVMGESVNNHDELMANFFAQPDALAFGLWKDELKNMEEALKPHREFPGDRPSLSILMGNITPRTVGQLLALYEHRVAVQGFIWNVNSFDQWGVELGKVLAKQTRGYLGQMKKYHEADDSTFHPATVRMMKQYLQH